jgi:uncharacterized protein
LKCPLDKSDMIVIEHRKIELDVCLVCSGVWFDAGELDILVSTLAVSADHQTSTDLLSLKPGNVKEARRRCPICARKMDKMWLGQEPKILIDHCPLGHGLWFDGGELRQFLNQIVPDDSAGVISFLGDAFLAPDKSGQFSRLEKGPNSRGGEK